MDLPVIYNFCPIDFKNVGMSGYVDNYFSEVDALMPSSAEHSMDSDNMSQWKDYYNKYDNYNDSWGWMVVYNFHWVRMDNDEDDNNKNSHSAPKKF